MGASQSKPARVAAHKHVAVQSSDAVSTPEEIVLAGRPEDTSRRSKSCPDPEPDQIAILEGKIQELKAGLQAVTDAQTKSRGAVYTRLKDVDRKMIHELQQLRQEMLAIPACACLGQQGDLADEDIRMPSIFGLTGGMARWRRS